MHAAISLSRSTRGLTATRTTTIAAYSAITISPAVSATTRDLLVSENTNSPNGTSETAAKRPPITSQIVPDDVRSAG